jgi:multidrug resistance efflux pump
MSAEYTLMTRQGAATGKGSSAAYAAANAAVEAARAEDFLLREVEARTEQLLVSRQRIERAKRALADARAALIQGAWTDGTLADKADLADAVSGLLAPA